MREGCEKERRSRTSRRREVVRESTNPMRVDFLLDHENRGIMIINYRSSPRELFSSLSAVPRII